MTRALVRISLVAACVLAVAGAADRARQDPPAEVDRNFEWAMRWAPADSGEAGYVSPAFPSALTAWEVVLALRDVLIRWPDAHPGGSLCPYRSDMDSEAVLTAEVRETTLLWEAGPRARNTAESTAGSMRGERVEAPFPLWRATRGPEVVLVGIPGDEEWVMVLSPGGAEERWVGGDRRDSLAGDSFAADLRRAGGTVVFAEFRRLPEGPVRRGWAAASEFAGTGEGPGGLRFRVELEFAEGTEAGPRMEALAREWASHLGLSAVPDWLNVRGEGPRGMAVADLDGVRLLSLADAAHCRCALVRVYANQRSRIEDSGITEDEAWPWGPEGGSNLADSSAVPTGSAWWEAAVRFPRDDACRAGGAERMFWGPVVDPNPLPPDAPIGACPPGSHPGGTFIVTGDGDVRWVAETDETFRRLREWVGE